MTKPHNDTALDAHGNRLPYSPAEVRTICLRAIDEGTILAVILQLPDGDMAVQVFQDQPTPAILEALEAVTTSFRALVQKAQH